MPSDMGVFVVQRQTDGVWEANCISTHCGHGMHGVIESTWRSRADAAARRHRLEIHRELAAIEEREARAPVNWQAVAEQRERRLAALLGRLARLRSYARHEEGCGAIWGGACICGLDELLNPDRPTPQDPKETPNG